MIASLVIGRPVRVVIRNLRITAASPLEARRLADVMTPALERVLRRMVDGTPGVERGKHPADGVAAQIADVIEARLRRTR